MPSSLADLSLQPEYRSDRASLAAEFFAPCLGRAVTYDRAVGFFQSSSLAALADGLEPFLARKGTIRVVASPRLDPADAEALADGYERRRQYVLTSALSAIAEFPTAPDYERDRLECLAWLVARGRLDLRLALVVGHRSVGMYHEKLGIFADETCNTVAFSGSANESFGGLVSNFECIDVFCSWVHEDAARARGKRDSFDRLWTQKTRGVEIFEFPEAARRRLLELAPASAPVTFSPMPAERATTDRALFGFPVFPSWFTPRDYQKDAVAKWLSANGRGVFAMATGTGKTLTALSVVVQVARSARQQCLPLLVVIVCPLKHLVTQWATDVEAFGADPLLCFEGAGSWAQHADVMQSALNGGRAPFGVWITTNATFQGDAIQNRLEDLKCSLMLVADEMHNLGSPKTRALLPEKAQFRLGLSATPERHNDEVGTGALYDYFGEPVFQLPIEDAIRRKILTPYRYHPILVELEEEELEAYAEVTGEIWRALGGELDELDYELPPHVKVLLTRRNGLVGGARRKLSALKELIASHADDSYSLVYCSDSTVNGTDLRQVEAVVDLLGRQLQMRVAPYTYETSMAQRRQALQLFENGLLNALVAIRCLDEGVDIPATRRAYILASTANPRQYIQRRGRVLRRAPGKEEAEIFDFVTVPPEGSLPEEFFEVERRIVGRELTRVLEFARSAQNGAAAMSALLPLQQRYGLLHVA